VLINVKPVKNEIKMDERMIPLTIVMIFKKLGDCRLKCFLQT